MAPMFLPSAFGVVADVLKITILQKFGSMAQKSARLDIFCRRISSKIQGKKNSRRISSKIQKKSVTNRVLVWMEGSPFLEQSKLFPFSDWTPVLGSASVEDCPPGTAIGALTELKLQCTFRLHKGNRDLSRLET